MGKNEKLVTKMRANPRDWRMESLESVAKRYGIDVRKTVGNHFVLFHPDSDLAVTVSFKRPIKPIYIVQPLALLDDIGGRIMARKTEYPFELRPLSDDEGSGWLVSFPDLPGCISDGETPEEAMHDGKDAVAAWLQAAKESGREIPKPGELPSGKFIARIPRSLHARLTARARQEGVSMNALVSAFLAEAIGRRDGSKSSGL